MKRAAQIVAWSVIDLPAMYAAGALHLLMLLTLPMHKTPRHDLWTPAGYPTYTWAWANRWCHRLDAIGFDGLSYWLRLRCGKREGGNADVPMTRWCRVERTS